MDQIDYYYTALASSRNTNLEGAREGDAFCFWRKMKKDEKLLKKNGGPPMSLCPAWWYWMDGWMDGWMRERERERGGALNLLNQRLTSLPPRSTLSSLLVRDPCNNKRKRKRKREGSSAVKSRPGCSPLPPPPIPSLGPVNGDTLRHVASPPQNPPKWSPTTTFLYNAEPGLDGAEIQSFWTPFD